MSAGSRLKAARIEKGYTQEGVAHYLNQSLETVKSWERDRSRPRSFKMIGRLCDYLGISTDHYIHGRCNQSLSSDENELLNAYRAMPANAKTALITLAAGYNPPD